MVRTIMNNTTSVSKANAAQQSAIDSNAHKILCLAGAGTGKTFTLIERIGRLVKEGMCQGENILALTFTNAAAFEMKERYAKKFSYLNSSLPEFRTFHAFCYSLISNDVSIRTKLGYNQGTPPQICSEEVMKQVRNKVMLQCNIKLSEKKLYDPSLLTDAEQFQYELFHKGFAREMRQRNIITFNALCYKICQLFSSDSELIQRYKRKYTYIFVDEFQDTDPKQWNFVQSFKDSDLFIVGDALQALYGFRNADSSIIKELSENPEWECIKLYENYRSTKQICDFANNMSHYADDNYRIEIQATRDGDPVYQSAVVDGDKFRAISREQLDCILTDISMLNGYTAVLCRSNAERSELIEYLQENEIEVATGKTYEEATHIFESARDNDYLVTWLATYLNDADYSDWTRLVALHGVENNSLEKYKLFRSTITRNKIINEHLQKIMRVRSIMKSNATPEDKQSSLFKLLKIRKVGIRKGLQDNSQIAEYISEILGTNTEADVYVGTIHSAKGLEYDNVILVGVDGIRFGLKKEEDKNCYYVGITRAKNWLKVYWAQKQQYRRNNKHDNNRLGWTDNYEETQANMHQMRETSLSPYEVS